MGPVRFKPAGLTVFCNRNDPPDIRHLNCRALRSMTGDLAHNRQMLIDTISMGRSAQPEDIAAAALYLVEDNSSFVTGVMLEVDGGRCV